MLYRFIDQFIPEDGQINHESKSIIYGNVFSNRSHDRNSQQHNQYATHGELEFRTIVGRWHLIVFWSIRLWWKQRWLIIYRIKSFSPSLDEIGCYRSIVMTVKEMDCLWTCVASHYNLIPTVTWQCDFTRCLPGGPADTHGTGMVHRCHHQEVGAKTVLQLMLVHVNRKWLEKVWRRSKALRQKI